MSGDLVADITITRLISKVVKQRLTVLKSTEHVVVKEEGFMVCGYWTGKIFHVEVAKEAGK